MMATFGQIFPTFPLSATSSPGRGAEPTLADLAESLEGAGAEALAARDRNESKSGLASLTSDSFQPDLADLFLKFV